MGRGDGGGDGDADRPADLLGGVEQPGGDPGIVIGDTGQAPIDTGMNAKAVPPARNNGPARFAQKCPCTGTWVAHRIPAPTKAIPAAMTSLAEARVTRIWAGPASARKVTEVASQVTPVFSAE